MALLMTLSMGHLPVGGRILKIPELLPLLSSYY